MIDLEAGALVHSAAHGHGKVLKRHKNGRYAVRFEGEQLPRSVDRGSLLLAGGYTGTDYE